jgi:hypothetical protein
MPLVEHVFFLLLCPVFATWSEFPPEIDKTVLHSTSIALKWQIFLFNIANPPAEFVVDRRNARMRRKRLRNLQNGEKFLKAKLRTKSPEAASVAPFDFRPPSFERSNEFRKNGIKTAFSKTGWISIANRAHP